MLFIEINGEKYPCKIKVFTTQFGQKAIRVISSEAPVAEDGFLIVNNYNEIVTDCEAYKYLYNENGDCKEYTVRPEEIISPGFSYMGDQPESIYNVLSRQINAVSSQVNAITPYEESKKAYIDDTECVFKNIVKEGTLTVNVVDRNGISINNQVTREGNNIIITFEPLEEVATVSIIIQ